MSTVKEFGSKMKVAHGNTANYHLIYLWLVADLHKLCESATFFVLLAWEVDGIGMDVVDDWLCCDRSVLKRRSREWSLE